MKKFNSVLLLAVLVCLLLAINYNFIDGFLKRTFGEYEGGIVQRVIDGDTVVVNNVSVRLLGINCPEKGELYYDEAKEFLEKEVLGKGIKFEFSSDRIDLYGRTLAYLILENRNINIELVEEGLANCYFLNGREKYYDECFAAWGSCIEKNINLCESSEDKCADCVELENLDYENEVVVLKNICSFECDLDGWTVKDEGRKKFEFENFVLGAGRRVEVVTGEGEDSGSVLFWEGQDYVWTDSGDTLFLRDGAGKLVLYHIY